MGLNGDLLVRGRDELSEETNLVPHGGGSPRKALGDKLVRRGGGIARRYKLVPHMGGTLRRDKLALRVWGGGETQKRQASSTGGRGLRRDN